MCALMICMAAKKNKPYSMNRTTIEMLAAPGVAELKPYQPGKPLDELEREYGVSQAIKLASNENPLGPSAEALLAIQKVLPDLARYPDGNGFALKSALSKHLSVRAEQITLGNGSNDILELVARAFVTPNNEVIFSQHAFAVYPIVTQAVGAKAVVTPALNWGHDLTAMLSAITAQTRLIFIANPNNPTGTWLGKTALKDFLDKLPAHVLVVLDEAYFEYANDPAMGAKDYPDGVQWVADYPNLIVTRTFSKAYGLAGLRVGYAISSTEIADYLNRVRQPFNVNSVALAAAEVALQDKDHLAKSIEMNVQGMQQFVSACEAMGLEYIPSVANFISIKVGKADAVYEGLLHKGVIVRPVANYEMPEFLRITVGTENENDLCINAMDEVLSKN